MKLSASKAAKEVGVSIPTITRAIKSGRLSAEPTEGGGFLIDPSELFRAFPVLKAVNDEKPDSLGGETPNFTSVLAVEVKLLREQIALMQQTMADLRTDRDKWQVQAELWQAQTELMTTRLLAGPAQTQPSRSWWKRFGK